MSNTKEIFEESLLFAFRCVGTPFTKDSVHRVAKGLQCFVGFHGDLEQAVENVFTILQKEVILNESK